MARLISFWGKGGSGKSTLAAAAALAQRRRGRRVLAVSTDPSPALSPLLCGDEGPAKMRPCSGVTVFEVDEDEVKKMWIERFGDEVYEVVSAFLPVGREIIDYVAGAPGVPDQFMLYLVYTLAGRKDYDVVVWDTAAAGGSLRLLRIEYELYSHLGQAARLYLRVRGSLEKLRRRQGKQPIELIEEWRRLAAEILAFLGSSSHRLVVVTQPDALGLHVARTLLREFSLHGLEPYALVVNMVIHGEECPCCRPWLEDADIQQRVIRELRGLAPRLCLVPRLEKRPQGPGDLEPLVEHVERCLG